MSALKPRFMTHPIRAPYWLTIVLTKKYNTTLATKVCAHMVFVFVYGVVWVWCLLSCCC